MQHQSVYSLFVQTTKDCPQNDFLYVLPETANIYGIEAGPISYIEALAEVERLSQIYAKSGYGHGHRIGILLENRPNFIMHWLALNKLGVSIVPINPDLRLSELAYLINHSELILIVALPHRHADLNKAALSVGKKISIINPNMNPPPALTIAPYANSHPSTSSECALMYTSGTTGRPKGCILSNDYFLLSGDWYANIGGLASLEKGSERMLTPLPLFHMNALATSTMAMITIGGCLSILDRFHPKTWWDSVRKFNATIIHYLGIMPAILMQLPPEELDNQHNIRFGFGAGVDASLHKSFEMRFKFPLLEAWAMTETGASNCIMANKEPRYIGTNCFGKEGKFTEFLLIDDEGKEISDTTPGELLVRSKAENHQKGFFSGYWKDPEATDLAWKKGWFHTGDIVRRDEYGYLHFVDRKKNVIRRSGENIAAIEVENTLLHHESIKSIAISAVPDTIRGDEVMALIVPHKKPSREQEEALATEIVTWALTQLAYYKVPGYVVFVDSIPLTSTNKIQRGELKKLALNFYETNSFINTNHLKKRQ